MRSDLVVYLVVAMVLILLMLLPRWLWRRGQTAPTVPKRTRAKQAPKPFVGYTHKPECELCDDGMDAQRQEAPGAPPPLWPANIVSPRLETDSSMPPYGRMSHTALDIHPLSRDNKSEEP